MINRNYYYLIAGLPELVADEKKLNFTSVEFRASLRENLSPADFDLAMLYYLPYDHQNLLNFIFKKNIDWNRKGNYPQDIIENICDRKTFDLAYDMNLPLYLYEFLNRFYGEDNIDNYYVAELLLTSAYYDYLSESPNQFIKDCALHDKTVRNVMAALSGRKHASDYEPNLVGDDEITSAIKKSRARDFGLSGEFPDIETLMQIYETENLVDKEYKLDLYKWQYLDEITFFNYFTVEKILAYIQKLFIAERWYGLDKDKGRQMFNKILSELKTGFQLPNEFTIAYGKKR